ncbi:MAG: tRNA pseudouridine(38-40) synthase TruA [Bacteroidetes bacterium]|nr:tRNA pseudouridine(38-40) synthase TruA [Bacteroidota bacterium]
MSRYFIQMAYDGTLFNGWQVQPNGKTVQEVMEQALSTLLQEEISVTGAGRTDTGVHASHFIAHFDTTKNRAGKEATTPDNPQFLFKLNRFLPEDVVIYSIREVPAEMHARFSATHRTYHYHISTIKPLYRRNYSHYLFGTLDEAAIEACCKIILETTDFTSFSKLHTDVKTNNCKVTVAHWRKVEEGYLFEIGADRFLRNMVRSIVGTLIDVGQGKLDPDDFLSIVNARDRGKAGQSAPARGLFLVDITYDGFKFST